jgi:hypothetical protein
MTNRLRIGAHIYLFIRKVLLRSTVGNSKHWHVWMVIAWIAAKSTLAGMDGYCLDSSR